MCIRDRAIPGTRPAGVLTAGVAQAYINLQNRMPGKEIVILGSGDIGLIMARRLTLEGAHVKGVYEINPIPSGLPRNIEQCLHDYNIPLYLSHTVADIRGRDRLESVVEKMDTAEGHLARIAENTGVSAGHLGELKEVIKKMIRDGLKVK